MADDGTEFVIEHGGKQTALSDVAQVDVVSKGADTIKEKQSNASKADNTSERIINDYADALGGQVANNDGDASSGQANNNGDEIARKEVDYPLPTQAVGEMTPPEPPETREEDIIPDEDEDDSEFKEEDGDINIVDTGTEEKPSADVNASNTNVDTNTDVDVDTNISTDVDANVSPSDLASGNGGLGDHDQLGAVSDVGAADE